MPKKKVAKPQALLLKLQRAEKLGAQVAAAIRKDGGGITTIEEFLNLKVANDALHSIEIEVACALSVAHGKWLLKHGPRETLPAIANEPPQLPTDPVERARTLKEIDETP